MTLSTFDLYSIGIGPSSSHTVGPMRAAKRFADGLHGDDLLTSIGRVRAELFGSLGATGHGHGSVNAVILGLEGEEPATVDTSSADERARSARATGELMLAGKHAIGFSVDDIVLHLRKSLPAHPNGMTFTAYDHVGVAVRTQTFYSVGGGFVVSDDEVGVDRVRAGTDAVPYPFDSAQRLLDICKSEGLRISDVMLANELTWRTRAEVRDGLLALWAVMVECVEAGCRTHGVLPGSLRVQRRAAALHERLSSRPAGGTDTLEAMDWVNLFALAVNEENAAGGRIVTAPTNGAAGIIPAVIHYYVRFVRGADEDGIMRFLLTAAAIGMLFKQNASISGAEVGCQGEVGSACSMAAGALCELLGGTPEQVENAAEIGIEHNLGLTCDPVGGLVQIPCIERNALASVKAINAARLAMNGTGIHRVSLDLAIKTMRETGRDMSANYKETSRGGLAVNIVEC
jgi:L-serine dehydratase